MSIMKKIVGLGVLFFLVACGSLEERIQDDMEKHCSCVLDKGFKDPECLEIMESIALKYQNEPEAAELIRNANIECGNKMSENGKDDASIRVR